MGSCITKCHIQNRIANIAEANPASLAFVFGSQRVTYGELEQRSDDLARRFTSLGVHPESLVALSMRRSPEFIIAALAAWKCQAAYLPLDPLAPAARTRWMIADAGACLAVTHDSIERIASTANPEATGDQLAYVIYTSGSTGEPKGVEITHRGLSNLISWHLSAFQPGPQDRAVFSANPAFDAAVWEVWPHLAADACIYIPDETVRRSPELMRDWMVSEKITIAFVPSPLADEMVTLDWPCHTALRVLLTGADTLHRYPKPDLPFALINNYGPTEATVVTTSGRVPVAGSETGLPSIGRPIDGMSVQILDSRRQPVPVGEEGEIYIAGAGVARGYRNRPDWTAERFFADANNPGYRVYKSGDRGRLLPSGEIAFLGRFDGQIKIRGYRIEPGEIENALNQHPRIRSSAVTAARGDDPPRLVAYLSLRAGDRPTAAELRTFLGERLPEYMAPAVFAIIEQIPVTPNGKVDRERLPPVSEQNLLAENASLPPDCKAPENEIEAQIQKAVESLLGVAPGVNENFFLVGGHSLLGTQLIARLRDLFGVEVSLRTIFTHPTIAGLSAEVEDRLAREFASLGAVEMHELGGDHGSYSSL